MRINRHNLILNVFVLHFIILFLWTFVSLHALDPGKTITQYSVNIWNMESGLPGNAVFAIQRTQDGYLWLGTQDGLVRFDGINFELYTREKIPQLKCNNIRALYEDQNGILWIGTSSGGLTRYKEGVFFTYPVTEQKNLTEIRAVNEDRRGNVWIGSFSHGLTCLNIRGGEFVTYTMEQGLPHNQVRDIFKDENGYLWVTTAAGVIKILNPGTFDENVSGSLRRLPYLKTVCLYETDSNTLWVGTGDSGLFSLKNGKLTNYGIEEGIPNPVITCLFKDRMNNLWIGSDGGGLTRMTNGACITLNPDDGLACGFVSSIHEDREGSLWVGTLDGGLHQLRDNKFTTYTTREGLTHDYTFCVYEDRAGDLWIGTREGLNRLRNGALTPEYSLKNPVSSLFEDPGGSLWIGTWGSLHRFKDGKSSTLTKKDGLSDNRIGCIQGDRQGNTWVGTRSGLNRFNADTGRFTVFTTREGLSGNSIKFIFEDRNGNLLVGTDTGLNYLKDESFTPSGLPAPMDKQCFNCAYEDNQGAFWFGTNSGLIRLKDKEPVLYTQQCGLVENYIFSILEDDMGNLWLAGRNGVSRISKKELEDFSRGKVNRIHPHSYNEKDGMISGWCTNTGCKTRDGRFWFPTSIGVAVIDPNNIKQDNLPPPPIVEKLIVDGESIYIHPNGRENNLLELAPGKERLEICYTSVSFINPKRIKFKLRLIGYDSNWVDVGTARTTTYTRLSPGHYTFKVMASNAGGAWNRTDAAFSFYLKPYYYQTTWFYLLVACIGLLTALSLFRLRIRQLKAREKELRTLVDIRTTDLKKSRDIIEEKNRNITDSIRYARKIQHAMLPMKEKMEKGLKDYFVIYEPKDIISGDFYWFNIIGDYIFLAAADCTGHGVPGALLSMIGHIMLDEVVTDKRIYDPATALAYLHQGFRGVLKQELEKSDTYDGMDLGLCRIDLKKREITFAGARRPLYYVKDSQLYEIKGCRRSIGGRKKEEKRVFTNHEIETPDKEQETIMLYLTTDGFADQHNPENKRYGSSRLKNFLQGIAHLNMEEQKEALLKELKKHQAYVEQRDDITIVGLQIPTCRPEE
jgi:ligand-binding sensor domain-containing protein/serine phosphatase RsbU (regulator of sigma subunit)